MAWYKFLDSEIHRVDCFEITGAKDLLKLAANFGGFLAIDLSATHKI